MADAPVRVQLRRTKGWRMPPNTVKVTRGRGAAGVFGNPFVEANDTVYAAPASIHFEVHFPVTPAGAYRLWLSGMMLQAEALLYYRQRRRAILEGLPSLRGKNLACWCALPKPGEPDVCHAAILLEIANRPVCTEIADV